MTLPFTNQSIARPLADHGEHASDGAAAVCHHDLLAALDALEVLPGGRAALGSQPQP